MYSDVIRTAALNCFFRIGLCTNVIATQNRQSVVQIFIIRNGCIPKNWPKHNTMREKHLDSDVCNEVASCSIIKFYFQASVTNVRSALQLHVENIVELVS